MGPSPWRYVAAFAVTFVLAAALTPLMRHFALRTSVVDAPDGERKLQTHAIPYLGGIAIALSATLTPVLASWLRGYPGNDLRLLAGVLLPALVLSGVGLLDDVRGLPPLPRFLAQSLAGVVTAALLSTAGTVATISTASILNVALTMFWVVGVTNALNLLDNTDGAASGTAAIAAVAFFAIAASNGQFLVAALAIALAGACAGFLVWNHHPARIYMGDSGSLFVGFMLAAIGMRLELVHVSQANALAVPIIVLAVPILDTSLVVASRIRRGVSPFVGGLDHLAHRLRRTGLDTRGTVRRIWLAGAAAGGLAYMVSKLDSAMGAVVVGLAAVAFVATYLYAFRLPETGDLS